MNINFPDHIPLSVWVAHQSQPHFASVEEAFKSLMGTAYDFYSGDVIDKWVYRVLECAFDGDIESLSRDLLHLKNAHPENQEALFSMAYMLAKQKGQTIDQQQFTIFTNQHKMISSKLQFDKTKEVDTNLIDVVVKGAQTARWLISAFALGASCLWYSSHPNINLWPTFTNIYSWPTFTTAIFAGTAVMCFATLAKQFDNNDGDTTRLNIIKIKLQKNGVGDLADDIRHMKNSRIKDTALRLIGQKVIEEGNKRERVLYGLS